jgi:proline iminopeptidase
LIISNMMASVPAYNDYAARVLMPQMNQDALAEIKRLEATGETENPRYEELLMEHFYRHHLLRMPPNEWPEPVTRSMSHLNRSIYVPMQGPSELGASGKLKDWDRSADLPRVHVPTLVIGAEHDTMNPAYLEAMAHQLPDGRYHHCSNGSHLAHIDDQQTYFEGLLSFLHDVDESS